MTHTVFPTGNESPAPHAQDYAARYTTHRADGKEADSGDRNPSWGWAAGPIVPRPSAIRTPGRPRSPRAG
ncbi:hypothetical protein AB0L59_23530 [Streptomyces sp. NPDC052109]|uniref:hypothetical protein n=1 Tax=Streptomyces sp. NPDC052109 TaxID=3155527 RepID=UPI003444C7FC